MQLECLGRGSGRKSRFKEMGRLERIFFLPASRQAALGLEYPRQIIDWIIILTAGNRPNIYILGNSFSIMHSWRLGVTVALMACGLGLLASPPQLPFRSGGACIFVCIMTFEFLNCWIVEWQTLCESLGPLASRGFCCCNSCFVGWLRPLRSSAKLWGTYKNFCEAFFFCSTKKLSSEIMILFLRPFDDVVCWGWELSFLDEHF